MSTLAEIEKAAAELAREQKIELMMFLAAVIRTEPSNERSRSGLLAEMAADPEIIRECRAIAREFAETELDGLAAK